MPPPSQQTAASAYLAACQREQTECALEFLKALNDNEKEALLDHRARALMDADLVCIAEALRCKHTIRVLSLEENHITSSGVQAIFDAILANPGYLRELRLGKNRLRDAAAVTVANALAFSGGGLKVLDLSENGLTKLGVGPLFQAIAGKHSDLVELSLHNNSLEADSAIAIAQTLRHGSGPAKLKHLHLGYNCLRDGGATQIARAIPLAPTLCTVDLTANRIGPQGGMEIARALLSPNCTLQRLNLRHNLFDDDTFAAFADVIIKNTSLTQLFLGFMRPSHATAASVLSTLRYNRTLLLFDCYGWTFAADDMVLLLENILNSNPTVRAIVTDSCQSVAHEIDVFNKRREDSGSHRVYIGGEDRFANDAVVAAKALQQQSRPGSRHGRSSTRDTTPDLPPASVGAGVGQRRGPPLVGLRNAPHTRAVSNGNSPIPQQQQQQLIASRSPHDRDIDALLAELKDVSMDADLRRNLSMIISQLQLKIDTLRTLHHEQMASLEDRVRSLEQRPCAHACHGTVVGGTGSAGATGTTTSVVGVPSSRPSPQQHQQQRSPSAGYSLDVTPTSGGEAHHAQQASLRPPPPHIRIVGRPVTPPARPEDGAGNSVDRPGTPEPAHPTTAAMSDAQQRNLLRGVPTGRPGVTAAASNEFAPQQSSEHAPSGRPHTVPQISFAKLEAEASRGGLSSQSPPVTSTVGQRRSASNPAAGSGGEATSRRSVSQSHAVAGQFGGPRRGGEGSASASLSSGTLFAEQQSPVNPHLQPSQHVNTRSNAALEASPNQQQRVLRKRPPAST